VLARGKNAAYARDRASAALQRAETRYEQLLAEGRTLPCDLPPARRRLAAICRRAWPSTSKPALAGPARPAASSMTSGPPG
jgi:hypothetical protein